MTKQELLKAIGTYDEKDLEDVLELLGIINGERYNDPEFNDELRWSNIKGVARNFTNPKFMYVEVWTDGNDLSERITTSINEAKVKGYSWHDTQYQLSNNNGLIIHSALLIFKKY